MPATCSTIVLCRRSHISCRWVCARDGDGALCVESLLPSLFLVQSCLLSKSNIAFHIFIEFLDACGETSKFCTKLRDYEKPLVTWPSVASLASSVAIAPDQDGKKIRMGRRKESENKRKNERKKERLLP
uniref:Uncharacterized protein n=1 Tax=Oryza meridionalis TaxID=40149 RepID=A0A0E0CEZ4_9ORYZ